MQVDTQTAINQKIGQSIKAARIRSNLTLAGLAEQCALSESFLSRLERGHASASIANLLQVCLALDIEIASLFGDLEPNKSKIRIAVHRREEDSFSFVPATGYRWKRLGGGNVKDAMEVFRLEFPKHQTMEAFVSHAGQEHCFVLSGEIIFEVGGESFHLRSGDGIFIDSELPHRARSVGAQEASVLMTVANFDGQQANFDWWKPATVTENVDYSSNTGGTNEQNHS